MGALLSCLRAPLGLDWTQLVALQATSAVVFRASGLLALMLALDPRGRTLEAGPRPLWLASLCAGYALHGLWLEKTPGSRAGYALLFLVGTVLARGLAGPRTPRPSPDPDSPSRVERLGLGLLGAACTLAFEALAHETRLFTMGTSDDDTLVGVVFLALLAVGALAFGPLLARVGATRVRLASGVALATCATWVGMLFLSALTPDGLYGYLRRVDVLLAGLRTLDGRLGGALGLAGIPSFDGASIGTHWTTTILAAATLVVPTFLLAGTLGSVAGFARVRELVLGAAIGILAWPRIASGDLLGARELATTPYAWSLVSRATGIAAAGLVLASLGAPRASRLVGFALALVVASLPWLVPPRVLWSFSPWSAKRVEPELVWPLAEGLLTLEPDVGAGSVGGGSIVTLDRRRLTPTREEEYEDGLRLRASWVLLAPERRGPGVRALFVGQLTPARADVLRALGVESIDRTAAWHVAMPALEARLFAGSPPKGAVLTPRLARKRLHDEEYDWVLAAPAAGPIVTWKSESREIWGGVDAPRLADLELEGKTVGVAWVQGDARVEQGLVLEPALLTVDRLERFSIGLVRGPFVDSPPEQGPLFRFSARDVPSALAFLGTMPQQRSLLLQGSSAAGLECSSSETLARGLALHFAAQRFSSPYESRAQQVEIDEEALRAFAAAVPERLDRLSREIWESLAWLLQEKRLPEEALVFLEPVAERFAPWKAVDRAMARAYREMLDPASAMRFLDRARSQEPGDLWLLIDSAAVAEELGQPDHALGHLEAALALPIIRTPDQERALGLALQRLGDGRGRPMLEKRLLEAPEDREVRESLGLPPLGGEEF
jgi:hypothetical protein